MTLNSGILEKSNQNETKCWIKSHELNSLTLNILKIDDSKPYPLKKLIKSQLRNYVAANSEETHKPTEHTTRILFPNR